MAINRKTVDHILRYLEGEIKIIENSHVTREALGEKGNLMFTDATKHRMQIAIEMTINIAEHIACFPRSPIPSQAS